MARYAIETDEPIEKCESCPIYCEFGWCKHELKDVESDQKPPNWCPLQRLDDMGEANEKKAVLRIQQVLGERGLSQSKAARLADVNETSMSRIVRGIEPAYPKRGKRIADALGWEGDWHELFEKMVV